VCVPTYNININYKLQLHILYDVKSGGAFYYNILYYNARIWYIYESSIEFRKCVGGSFYTVHGTCVPTLGSLYDKCF